jgi:hypothetical protein
LRLFLLNSPPLLHMLPAQENIPQILGRNPKDLFLENTYRE